MSAADVAITNARRPPLLPRIATRLGIPWERDDQGRRRVGTWIQSYSGGKIWPLDPLPEDFTLDDWVVGTARECRFGRMSREWYSVCEHEIIVSLYAENFARALGWPEHDVLLAARQGLVHDKAEAVAGDMPRPMKHQPQMAPYRRLEDRLQRCAYAFFGVRPTRETTALVKEVDNRVLVDEIYALMLEPGMYLERHAQVRGLGAEIAAMPWQQAADAWCQRFRELWPDWAA